MALWGLAWTNGKVISGYTAVSVLIFWRFTIGSASMVPFLLILKIPLLPKKQGLPYVIGGACFMIGYNFFFLLGTRIGLPGAGGILVTTLNPIFTFIFTALMFRHSIAKKDLFGLVLGFIGGSIMINIWTKSLSEIMQSGNAFFLFASCTWAFVTIVSSRSKKVMHPLTFSFWAYILSGLISIPFVWDKPILEVFTFDFTFWWHFISLSIGSMAVGTSIFFVGAAELGSSKASGFIFTVPVTAMGFSMLILGERLTLPIAIGSIFTMTAVYLITILKH